MASHAEHYIVRVYGPDLDPKKNWYALSHYICSSQPHKFAQNAIFKRFPEEIRRVNRLNLALENGIPSSPSCFEDGSKKSGNGEHLVYAATTFGLLAGILRHRNLDSYQGFLDSETVSNLIRTINEVNLESNIVQSQSTTPTVVKQLLASIEARDKEILMLQEELNIVRERLQQLTQECSISCHTSHSFSSPVDQSTPKRAGSNLTDSGYDAINSSSPNCSDVASDKSLDLMIKSNLEVADFLQKQLEYWDTEQKGLERKFVQLTAETDQLTHPKRKPIEYTIESPTFLLNLLLNYRLISLSR